MANGLGRELTERDQAVILLGGVAAGRVEPALEPARQNLAYHAVQVDALLAHEAGLSVFRATTGGAAVQQSGRAGLAQGGDRPVHELRVGLRGRGGLLDEQMYSIYATLHLAGFNPYRWIWDSLEACGRNSRNRPADLRPWLPWRTDANRRTELSRPLPSRQAALPAPANRFVASLARSA